MAYELRACGRYYMQQEKKLVAGPVPAHPNQRNMYYTCNDEPSTTDARPSTNGLKLPG